MKTDTTTLADLISSAKCRTGKAHAITDKGAYWLAAEPIVIKSYGGDGIGQSRADMRNHLELRHYRDGKRRVVIVTTTWHQNYGRDTITQETSLCSSETVEDVVISLKNTTIGDSDYDGSDIAFSDYNYDNLAASLMSFGLPEYPIPSPDEELPED